MGTRRMAACWAGLGRAVVPPPTPRPSTRRPSTTMEMCSAPALSAAPTTNVTPDRMSTHCGQTNLRVQGFFNCIYYCKGWHIP